MHPQIVLLNGSSSSGKSTLAKALRMFIWESRNESYEIVSIDDFLEMENDKVIYEEDVFQISNKLCEKVLEIFHMDKGVIIDHVITSERIFKQLYEYLHPYQIHMIRVTCPLPILRQREAERKNRCLGSAEASQDYLYPKDGYDRTVDTFLSTSEDCSRQIIEVLDNRSV